MTHGSLFSGGGGFDLAAQWMGWDNVFHCEINPFGQQVLRYYWPDAELFTDITKSDFTKYADSIDILSGGFPCQPYSAAGKRLGKEDERHLWPEMLRAIREIRPPWVVGENVRGLTNWNNGVVFDEVQADLEAQGFEVTPFLLPAAGVNAPHERYRIWFVAYSRSNGHERRRYRENRPAPGTGEGQGDQRQRLRGDTERTGEPATVTGAEGLPSPLDCEGRGNWERILGKSETGGRGIELQAENNAIANPEGFAEREPANEINAIAESGEARAKSGSAGGGRDATHANGAGRGKGHEENENRLPKQPNGHSIQQIGANPNSNGLEGRREPGYGEKANGQTFQLHARDGRHAWENFPSEPPICGRNDGLSPQLDGITFSKWRNESIKLYGNAVVPQVVLQIFKAIEQWMQENPTP